VFDCAFAPRNGRRFIPYLAHLKMMSAVQPFLSGAISKTINMPRHSTPEEIMETYLAGWRLGLKAVAIYRDGSKRSQPVSASREHSAAATAAAATVSDPGQAGGNGAKSRPLRRRMPTSPVTRAISPSASTRTTRPASCSSRWPRKAVPSAD
jgi:ribonucleoside-diphosphate reductase alpha chain